MAYKRRKTTRRRATRKRTAAKTRAVMVVGKRRRSRRVSGAVGSTTHRRRRKRSIMGSTSSSLKQVAYMAVGVGAGAMISHIILKPVEAKLVTKWPMLGKFVAAGEVFLGGVIALKGKGDLTKSVGVGILAGGVHGLMKQFGMSSKSMHGIDDYSTIRIPISGTDTTSMVAGLLKNTTARANTDYVAGREQDRTAWVASPVMDTTYYDMSNIESTPYTPLGFED